MLQGHRHGEGVTYGGWLTCMPREQWVYRPLRSSATKAQGRALPNADPTQIQTASKSSQARDNPTQTRWNMQTPQQSPAGCPYGKACIFIYQCTQCRHLDHEKKDCSYGKHNDTDTQWQVRIYISNVDIWTSHILSLHFISYLSSNQSHVNYIRLTL